MNGINTLILPDEILSLICQELGNKRDFATLFRCAQSSSTLADIALLMMYSIHESSPAFILSDEERIGQHGVEFDLRLKQQDEFFRKWTVLWRSIIASSLDHARTYKPYCRYLRTLDFRNLAFMMEDSKFTGKVRKSFFAGGLNHLHFLNKEFKRQGIDIVATINAVGDTVIPQTYLLEEVAGELSPGYLTRWLRHLAKIQNLVLYKGAALAEGAGAAISEYCSDFKNLTIHAWIQPDADDVFAQFLNEMLPNTLQYFEMISYNELGPKSFEALGRHKTLKELRLGTLEQEAILNLNQLKGCTEIETLVLHDNTGIIELEVYHHNVFVEVVEWLSTCEKLRDLTLKKLWDGPAMLAQVLVAPGVRLTRLSVEGYVVRGTSSRDFHAALSEQKSLESLSLKGHGEEIGAEDLDLMVQSLSSLSNLKELYLKDVSDEFGEEHITQMAVSLPKLEEFWTSGGEVSAEVLNALANLKHLNSLNLYALTQFSSDSILNFLLRLDPVTQRGFTLSLMSVDPSWDLSESEQDTIREFIKQNFGGRFEFVLWREESSDSEED